MVEIKQTGGAIIGFAHASFPFATLIVNKNTLQLRASIIGNLIFRPTDIISIEPYSYFLSKGIKINHSVGNYNSKVIFLTSGAYQLISDIQGTGFLTNREIPEEIEEEISVLQLSSGFPFKTSAIITIVVIWNLLCLISFKSFFGGSLNDAHSLIGFQFATAFAFLTCLFLLISRPFRKLVLKPGKTVDDIRLVLYFIMLITGIMFLGYYFMFHN